VRVVRGRLAPGALGTLGTLGPKALGTAKESPWLRRGALAAVLLCVAFVPYPSQGSAAVPPATHAAQQNMLRWTQPLPGEWNVQSGLGGTVPSSGVAYAATGYGVVAVGAGMTVYAYSASTGKARWQYPLTGFPASAAIVSVRAWPGEVTVGVAYQNQRTEVVMASSDGTETGQYPAAPFGGAVAGTARYTVIVGPTSVTSYDNVTGHIRWERPTGAVAQGWEADGQYLYVAESAGGYLGSAPVTALRRIAVATGAEQEILPGQAAGSAEVQGVAAFDGTLSAAFGGVVLFSSASGVTAYSETTGVRLWSQAGTVPEGADPEQGRFYLARGSTLLAVRPRTGRILATVPAGGVYAVRDGVALGLDPGAEGDAWGYYIAAQRVAMTASGLGWPHYFVDLSGLGGSADPGSSLVVIAACAQAGPAVQPAPSGGLISPSPDAPATPPATTSPSPSTSPSATVSPSASATPSPPAAQACVRPELVGLGL
jgi:outer membrane protein assembly factor BamB